MSFSGLSDLFEGRVGSRECLVFLLSLKAPESAREYLYDSHKRVFPYADSYKNASKRWQEYPCSAIKNVKPVLDSDMANLEFTKKIAEKLSFDISRFTDFIDGYARVAEDIKPVMLHYAMNYLLDFFSRTYLKYGQSMSHGVKMMQQEGKETLLEAKVKILENGIFPRAVDAFYATRQSSLFSNDDIAGIGYYTNAWGETTPARIPKLECCKEPQVTLGELLTYYRTLNSFEHVHITIANKILTGYLILFLVSSISRYRAKDWFMLRQDRDMSNRIELLNYDFVSAWIPELLLQTSLVLLETGSPRNPRKPLAS
jgi:hypothetical protein